MLYVIHNTYRNTGTTVLTVTVKFIFENTYITHREITTGNPCIIDFHDYLMNEILFGYKVIKPITCIHS